MKGKISKSGYRKDSPDRKNDFNIIQSPLISMVGVTHPVFGISDTGESRLMLPGEKHTFEKATQVFEIPVKDAKKDFYPFFMQMGGDTSKVKTPEQLKLLKRPGDLSKAEQNIAAQYNLEGLPSMTERTTWNGYLDWVESQGYKAGSDSLLSLNKGTNRFAELSDAYNKQQVEGLKLKYKTAKSAPGFNKAITEEQFIQSRMVNPQMMMNAQKVYGQQTSKDQWFGSETARTFYPEVRGLGPGYENVNDKTVQQKIAAATGKLAPVQVFDYKTKKPVPYQGVVPITGYDPKGSPQYDFGKVQPFQQELAPNVYYDPAALPADRKQYYQSFLPQQQKGGPVQMQNSFFTNFIKPHFETESKDVAPQGQDTNTFIQNKRDYFLDCLKKNVSKHVMSDTAKEISDYMNCGGMYKAQDGMQVNLIDPNDPLKNPNAQSNSLFVDPNMSGPFGQPTNTNPVYPEAYTYLNTAANNNPTFYTDPKQAGTPSNLNLTPGVDANKIAYQKYLDENNRKATNAQNLSNGADLAMAGMNIFSNAAEFQQNKNYQNKLRDQMSAENIFSNIKGSRGDYDMNSGAFRPNNMTVPSYKRGGQYSVDEKELSRLKSLGYQFEIIE